MKKLFLAACLFILSCTTPDTPAVIDDSGNETGPETSSGVDAAPVRVGSNLELLNTSEKITSCYKMTVMVDRDQGVVCYILVSQCSSGVPSISCVKQ